MGSLSLLQGIFPSQESNQGLLHCRQILYQLSYFESLTNSTDLRQSVTEKNHYRDLRMRERDKMQRHHWQKKPWKKTDSRHWNEPYSVMRKEWKNGRKQHVDRIFPYVTIMAWTHKLVVKKDLEKSLQERRNSCD